LYHLMLNARLGGALDFKRNPGRLSLVIHSIKAQI
jgi:hypothetical protein